MKLIITGSIRKTEIEAVREVFPFSVIKLAAKKALRGLGSIIKSSEPIKGTVLKKIYITGTSGAGRSLFLLQINSDKAVLVMLKNKKDKKIGANMTVKNANFKKLLEKNLDLILSDLRKKDFDEYDIN